MKCRDFLCWVSVSSSKVNYIYSKESYRDYWASRLFSNSSFEHLLKTGRRKQVLGKFLREVLLILLFQRGSLHLYPPIKICNYVLRNHNFTHPIYNLYIARWNLRRFKRPENRNFPIFFKYVIDSAVSIQNIFSI